MKGATITAALTQISSAAAKGQIRSHDVLAADATKALLSAPSGLTKQGAAAFLATLGQEGAYYRATEEYAKNGRYAPYIGRTFEMITWRENYAKFGAWCKSRKFVTDANVFVNNYKKLADYEWAWLGGVWYFEAFDVWKWANKGDFLSVSQIVNMGAGARGSSRKPNGWADRLAMYDAFLSAGADLLPNGSNSSNAGTSTTKRRTSLLLMTES